MNEVETKSKDEACNDNDPNHKTIRIQVNNTPVELARRRVTGLVIKQTAIDQGVRIEFDFVLFLERGNGQRQVIGDNDKITVRQGSRFDAIPHDDNS